MFGEERKAKILECIQKQYRASVQELSETFLVSESTIRRDLQELEEAKLVKRTHGGAVSLQAVNFEPTFREKEVQFQKEKEAIAKRAVQFIQDGETILLDSGTTTFYLAKELRGFSHLRVVTNSFILAQELHDIPGIELMLTGGALRKETLALVGPLTEQAIDRVRVDKTFLAMNGLDIKHGLTTPNIIEANTKRKMIQAAKEVILLVDHSKVGDVAFAKVADVAEIDTCVIDSAVSESVTNNMRKLGVRVYAVHP